MLTHANLLANTAQCAVFMEKAGIGNGIETAAAPLPLYHIYAFMLHCLLMLESGNHSLLIPESTGYKQFYQNVGKAALHSIHWYQYTICGVIEQ
jgi:long-chain acyl-CoA synthetase